MTAFGSQSMTIGRKLMLGTGAALVLTLVLGVVALRNVAALGTDLGKIININSRKIFLAGDANVGMAEVIGAERGLLTRVYMKDRPNIDRFNQECKASLDRTKKRLEEISTLLETDQGRRTVAELQSNVEQVARNHEEFYRLAITDKPEVTSEFLKDKLMPFAVKVSDGFEKFVVEENEVMAAAAKQSDATVYQGRLWTIGCLILSVLVAAVAIFVVLRINRNLSDTVNALHQGAEQLAGAAGQVSSSSQSLAQGASEQAASLEETSASSEEINSMARKNTENTRLAAELMAQSHQKFTETNRSLEQMVVAMGEINSSSDKISKIIKVIDEIAFQTNILALNAAVEAARAGEAGMGFAVVADEVRNLAQRCAQAAKDTASLIEDSIAKSNDGKTKVDQVAAAIQAITDQGVRVKTLVDEVNLGSQEQAQGIGQIGKAITQMEQVTQKTAANAEESASAAEELNAQSEVLREIVGRLSSMVGGAATIADAPRLSQPPKTKKRPNPKEPALAAAKLDRGSFPLDEDFKEF